MRKEGNKHECIEEVDRGASSKIIEVCLEGRFCRNLMGMDQGNIIMGTRTLKVVVDREGKMLKVEQTPGAG